MCKASKPLWSPKASYFARVGHLAWLLPAHALEYYGCDWTAMHWRVLVAEDYADELRAIPLFGSSVVIEADPRALAAPLVEVVACEQRKE